MDEITDTRERQQMSNEPKSSSEIAREIVNGFMTGPQKSWLELQGMITLALEASYENGRMSQAERHLAQALPSEEELCKFIKSRFGYPTVDQIARDAIIYELLTQNLKSVNAAQDAPSARHEVDECFERLIKIFGENAVLLYENAKQETVMDLFPNIEHYVGGWRDGCSWLRSQLKSNTAKVNAVPSDEEIVDKAREAFRKSNSLKHSEFMDAYIEGYRAALNPTKED